MGMQLKSEKLEERASVLFRLYSNTDDLLDGNLLLPILRYLNISPAPENLFAGDFYTEKEFLEYINNLKEENLITKQALVDSFKKFDHDGTGFIKIKHFMEFISEREIEELGRYMNLTDGRLDYEKFV